MSPVCLPGVGPMQHIHASPTPHNTQRPTTKYYCADVGAGGMHDAAHAHEQGDGGIPSFSFARRIRETMVPSIGRLLRRCRALGA